MHWIAPLNGLFTNDWLNWLFSTYTFFIAWIAAVIPAVLKLIAIRHPGVPTDAIGDLLKVIFTRPSIPAVQDEAEKLKNEKGEVTG